jgi:hypothetical protein
MVQLHARVVELPRDGPSSILFVDPKPLISRGLRTSGGENQLHTFASGAAVNSRRGRKHPAFEAWGLCRCGRATDPAMAPRRRSAGDPVLPQEEDRAREIVAWYSDKDWTLCDAISFAVLHVRGIRRAFTFDRHFLQYPCASPDALGDIQRSVPRRTGPETQSLG